jgi:hypothetical protein
MQFTLSTSTIIWKARHLNNTIDLMFMISWFVNNVINCETRFDFNQSSNHISIFYHIHIWDKFCVDQTKKSMKTRRRWKIAQQFAFIHRVVVIEYRWTDESLCKFHSIEHSQSNRCNCVVNEIRVEIEIALKSKVCRRRVDSETQTKSLIDDAHRTVVTKISQSDERKKENNCTKKKN